MTATTTSNYAWVITEDRIGENLVGVRGPSNMSDELSANKGAAIQSHPKAQRFALKDDDGEVYCLGYFVDLTGDADGFEPLDDYGTPSLGATSIEYYEDGEWKPL